MAGLKHDDERNPEAGLDLRDSPGDEPVRTVEDRSTDESFVPESARSEEAPRVQGLDLRDSPGDEPVRSHDDPTDRITSGDGEVAGVAGGSAESGDPRGRRADAPQEIPARGWLEVAKRVKEESRKDNLTLVSAGVAFYALLSLFPALAAMISIYGLVSDPADVTSQLNDLSSTMPAEARQILEDQLTAVASTGRTSLGFGVALGIVVALWGASSAMNQLLVGLTLVYDEEETRGPVKLRGMAIALTLGALVFLAVVVGLIAVLPAWLSNSPLGDAAATAVNVGRWPVLLVLMLAALALLYQVGPDRARPKYRWVSWGAVIATVLWLAVSIAFSFYASRFGSYNETYGTMGAVIVLMLWLLITSLCVLVGAEINAELEHQTAEDTTQGPRQPIGTRGAYVADTVAGES